jgi:hypothetical protein
MSLNLDGYEVRVANAVKSFWNIRQTLGVRSGKTLDAFIELLAWVVHNNGLPKAVVITGRQAKLPGFFGYSIICMVKILFKQRISLNIQRNSLKKVI